MKTERRGRPKNRETLITEGVIQPQKRKYTREFNYADGTKDVWTYDLDKNPRGPISVELFYPKDYNHILDYTHKDNHWIPVNNRTYIHPKTGKEISHNKALTLGLAR
jgi:hypothetical protein